MRGTTICNAWIETDVMDIVWSFHNNGIMQGENHRSVFPVNNEHITLLKRCWSALSKTWGWLLNCLPFLPSCHNNLWTHLIIKMTWKKSLIILMFCWGVFLQIMLVNDINKDTVVNYLIFTTIIYIYNCIVFYWCKVLPRSWLKPVNKQHS